MSNAASLRSALLVAAAAMNATPTWAPDYAAKVATWREAVAALAAARTVATPERTDLYRGTYADACRHFGGPARFVCGDVAPKTWRRA